MLFWVKVTSGGEACMRCPAGRTAGPCLCDDSRMRLWGGNAEAHLSPHPTGYLCHFCPTWQPTIWKIIWPCSLAWQHHRCPCSCHLAYLRTILHVFQSQDSAWLVQYFVPRNQNYFIIFYPTLWLIFIARNKISDFQAYLPPPLWWTYKHSGTRWKKGEACPYFCSCWLET
jgi:hypothetical protein